MRQKIADGDVFLIPLADGTFSIGQALWAKTGVMGSTICALFNLRGERPRIDAGLLDPKLIVAVQFVTSDSLKKGLWPIVRNEPVAFAVNDYLHVAELQAKAWVGARVIGSGIIDSFMNACFGLRSWDDWHDPEYFDKVLAPGVTRPPAAILTRR